jgi:hypothetical protein
LRNRQSAKPGKVEVFPLIGQKNATIHYLEEMISARLARFKTRRSKEDTEEEGNAQPAD